MAKTSSVYVRLEPKVKAESEAILNQLGIPMSHAISLFLKQVVLQRGIPFELKLPSPAVLEELTEEQLNARLEQGMAEYAAGKVCGAQEVRERMQREFGA